MGKKDILASAGIDLNDFEAGIDKLIASQGKIEKSAEKTNSSFKRLGASIRQAVGFLGVGRMFADIAAGMTQIDRKAGEVDEAFVAMGEAGLTAGQRFRLGLGRGLGNIADTLSLGATKPLTKGAEKQAIDEARISNELKTQAETYDEIIAKLRRLQDMKATEDAKKKGGTALSKSLAAQIAEATKSAEAIAGKQGGLAGDTSAGAEQRIALNKIEIEQAQKKADLANRLRDLGGNRTAADNRAFAAGIAAADAEAERQKKAVIQAEQKEIADAGIAKVAGELTVEYKSQLGLLEKQALEANVLAKAAADRFGIDSLIAAQAKAQAQQLALQVDEMRIGHDIELRAAKDAVAIKDKEMAGNKAVADLEKNRVQYAEQIREAMRHGNKELAEQLQKQQRLGELEIKAAQLRRTPQQKQADRREQEAQDRAIRHINAIEKNNPNSKPADGRNFVSPAAAKARAEFAARHGLNKPVDAADGLGQAVKDMRVWNMQIQSMKNGK